MNQLGAAIKIDNVNFSLHNAIVFLGCVRNSIQKMIIQSTMFYARVQYIEMLLNTFIMAFKTQKLIHTN